MDTSVFQNILIGIGLLNLLVSVFIVRRGDLENFQKFAQILIVWIIPLLGAIGMWIFHNNNDNPKSTQSSKFGGGSSDSSGAYQTGAPD